MAWLLFLFLASCVSHPERDSLSTRRDKIDEKILEAQAGLIATADPETNWPSKTDCDGTKWAGLACAGGYPVDIALAEYADGEIHRRPAPSCWNTKDGDVGARATISNDMLLGYLWCAWTRKDLPRLQRLANYGEHNKWVMGEPITQPGMVILKTNQIGILGRAIFVVSNGSDSRIYRHTPVKYLPVGTDWERQLQALGITLYGEITAGQHDDVEEASFDIEQGMLERLQNLVQAEPENPEFATALGIYTGDLERAVDLFLAPGTPVPTYVRGDNPAAFAWASRLFWLTKARARMTGD